MEIVETSFAVALCWSRPGLEYCNLAWVSSLAETVIPLINHIYKTCFFFRTQHRNLENYKRYDRS